MKPKKQTKTSFVLGLPSSMSARVVVAKAKAAGIPMTDKLVWAIRSDARKKKGHAPKKKAARATSKHSSHTAAELLRAVAAELGLSHAMAILKAEHDRVHRLLRG